MSYNTLSNRLPSLPALSVTEASLLVSAAQIPPFALPALHDAYSTMLRSASLAQVPMSPFLAMPPPSAVFQEMARLSGGGYAAKQSVDLAPLSPNTLAARAFDPARRDASLVEAHLRSDPFARLAFEQAIGGRIVDFGDKNDGRFTVERFAPKPEVARAYGGLSPIAAQLDGLFAQMARAGATGGVNPFQALALGGLGGIAQQLGGFDRLSSGVQGFPLFGVGSASWNPLAQPGKINGSNSTREHAHTAHVHSILSDPSLTMEDKIMLTIMLICAKLDDDIKRQTEYINNLQNQQGNRNKAGKMGSALGTLAGGALGGPIGATIAGSAGGKLAGGNAQDGEKTIDLETKKLERMMSKRANLFETMSKVLERYDQSAKSVIQSMRG